MNAAEKLQARDLCDQQDSGTDEEIPLPNVKTAILSKAVVKRE